LRLGRLRGAACRPLVKAGFASKDADDDNSREHVWMQGTAADATSITGTLVNHPADRLIGKKGVSKTITHEMVSDWVCVGGCGKPRAMIVERVLRKRRL